MLLPETTFAFCHSLLSSRFRPSAASPAAPLLSVQALLTTAGLCPHHPELSLVALNSLLRILSRGAASPTHPLLGLRLLLLMLSPSSPLPSPDHLSFPFALSAAASAPVTPSPGPQLHALLLKNALFPSDHYVTTALLQLHAPRPDDARRVFDELPRREAIHYDLLIGAYVGDARRFMIQMAESGHLPREHTYKLVKDAIEEAGEEALPVDLCHSVDDGIKERCQNAMRMKPIVRPVTRLSRTNIDLAQA